MSLSVNLYLRKNTLFIRLKGEMDQDTCRELRVKLLEVIVKYDVINIVFNLKDLEFLDSSGIGIIIGRYNQLKSKGGKVILCNLNDNIEKIIILSGLPKICTIKDSEESAKYYLEKV